MIWAFENDTSAIIKKLAKKSVKFDRKKNLFCLIAIIVAVSMVMMSLLTVQNIIHQNQTEVEELHQGIFFDITENNKEKILSEEDVRVLDFHATFKISNIIQKNYPSYIMIIRCLN